MHICTHTQVHKRNSYSHANSTEARNTCALNGCICRPLRDATEFYGGSTEVKDWEAQGRDITAEVTCSDKYKSLALHAEVKLAEALERCTRLCPDTYSSEGDEKPNKLKTAVCSQVRGCAALVSCNSNFKMFLKVYPSH